jgi:hypothetical protein
MDVTHDTEGGFVAKRAGAADERRRLQGEAAVLRVLAHPGVVQLVSVEGSDPPDGLVLRRVPGGDLRRLGPQSLEVIAGLGAAIATTLADLHDLGVQHGAIEASHVLLDDQGRPVLCSFGRAQRGLPSAEAGVWRRRDVRALARLLLAHLEPGSSIGVDRALRQAAGPGRQRRCRDARWLARRLAVRVPGARLPDPPAAPSPDQPQRAPAPHGERFARKVAWRRPVAALGIATGCGVVTLAVLAGTGRWSASSLPPGRQLPCPAVDAGCRPVATPAGVLTTSTGRYLVGEPDDVVILGRWSCGSVALPAVLRPKTGQLWTFAAWPRTGQGVPGQLVVNRVQAAFSLRVLVGASGCDRIELERHKLPPLTVTPPR